MPSISIDSKDSHGYGVKAENTLWCKQGILRIPDLRESEDEQFIADIVLSIALGTPFPASKVAFNNYYGTGPKDKSNEVELKVKAIGKESLKKDVKLVFSEIENFCDTHIRGTTLKRIINPQAKGNPIKEDFYSVFMAFYELIIKENKVPFDFLGIIAALTNVHARLSRDRKYTTTEGRVRNIAVCKGLLESNFKESTNTFKSSSTLIVDFKNFLMQSKVESAIYDYKQGLYTLDPKGRIFSETAFEKKIIKSIAAFANLGKGKKGFLFIGVTDTEEDTLRVETLDKLQDIPRYYGFGIVGLEREAIIRRVSLDDYITYITNRISASELPDDLKARVSKSEPVNLSV